MRFPDDNLLLCKGELINIFADTCSYIKKKNATQIDCSIKARDIVISVVKCYSADQESLINYVDFRTFHVKSNDI